MKTKRNPTPSPTGFGFGFLLCCVRNVARKRKSYERAFHREGYRMLCSDTVLFLFHSRGEAKEKSTCKCKCSLVVRETGLEPVRWNPHAPQTCASASSATLAFSCFARTVALATLTIIHDEKGNVNTFFEKNLKFFRGWGRTQKTSKNLRFSKLLTPYSLIYFNWRDIMRT